MLLYFMNSLIQKLSKMLVEQKEENTITEVEALLQKHEYHKCQSILSTLVHQIPDNPNLYLLLGKTYAALQMQRESMSYFMICIDLDPSNYKYHKEYAQALLKFDQLEYAEDSIREAIKLKRNSFQCHFCLGKILFEGFRVRQAKQTFQKCLCLSPGNEKVIKYLEKINKKLLIHEKEQEKARIQAQEVLVPSEVNQKEQNLDKWSLLKQVKALTKKLQIQQQQKRVQNLCKICFDQPCEYINLKCGHLCLGVQCMTKLKRVCPFCKTKGKYMKIFT